MNLKYHEDRFWFILISSTIPLFIIFPEMSKTPSQSTVSETTIAIMGFYFLFYVVGWFIYFCLNWTSFNEGYPKKENSRHFNPTDRIIWLEGEVKDLYPKEKYVEELAHLQKKYKSKLNEIKKTKDQRIKKARSNAKVSQARTNALLYGSYAAQIICPHCQTKGKVRKSTKERVEESREKGVIGATIGRKTITKKGRYTQLHCDKCDVTWEA
tara:strand:+ start:2070 stop:2705 length:636 start_codon:yes stop_codon:yes gene_type:complete